MLVGRLLQHKRDVRKYQDEIGRLRKAAQGAPLQVLQQHAPESDGPPSPSAVLDSIRAIPPPPDPTILTFTPQSVYTTGRRDLPDPPPSTTDNPLPIPAVLTPILPLLTSTPPRAEWHPTLRGGQTTYHGPGQLVAYTILDLQRLGMGPREHIRLLEESVLEVLSGYGVRGVVTGDPGVWVEQQRDNENENEATGSGSGSGGGGGECRKIAAVGVHLRRYVSSFGIGLNVTTEPMFFFRQIVACGLEGKEATSLAGEGVSGVTVEEVAGRFAEVFMRKFNERNGAAGVGIKEIYKVQEDDYSLG